MCQLVYLDLNEAIYMYAAKDMVFSFHFIKGGQKQINLYGMLFHCINLQLVIYFRFYTH